MVSFQAHGSAPKGRSVQRRANRRPTLLPVSSETTRVPAIAWWACLGELLEDHLLPMRSEEGHGDLGVPETPALGDGVDRPLQFVPVDVLGQEPSRPLPIPGFGTRASSLPPGSGIVQYQGDVRCRNVARRRRSAFDRPAAFTAWKSLTMRAKPRWRRGSVPEQAEIAAPKYGLLRVA